MRTKFVIGNRVKRFLVGILAAVMLLSVGIGLSAIKSASAAGTTYFRYDSNESTDARLAKYYYSHWSIGQGQNISGETGGRWYFGYGTVNNGGSYSFNQATKENPSNVGGDTGRYTTGYAAQLCWGYKLSTRLASTNAYSMYVYEATAQGTVSFTGIFAKAGDQTENISGQWLPGINTADADFAWKNGDSYTMGMYKVSGGTVAAIDENTATSAYAWLAPTTEIAVSAGDKVVFALKANSCAGSGDEWYTCTLAMFTSQFTETIPDPDPIDPIEPDPVDPTLPETVDDIDAPVTGFVKLAHYEFKDNTDLGKDSLNNYPLVNKGLSYDESKDGVEFSGVNYLYAPKLSQDGKDFSDIVKGSFSVSFRVYGVLGSENDEETHVIFGTGEDGKYFQIQWSTKDFVVKASEQEYRIDHATIVNAQGDAEAVYMLDQTPAWYRYSVIYDDNHLTMTIRIDRQVYKEFDNGTGGYMYGDMTVITKKTLTEKITFGGSVDGTLAIGADAFFGSYSTGYATGFDYNDNEFSPRISDLRVYSGIIDDAEITEIWKYDEGENYYDRGAMYKVFVTSNDTKGGYVSGVTNGAEYSYSTVLDIEISANYGYKIASVKWNGVPVALPTGDEITDMTIQKRITETSTLEVNYAAIKRAVTVTNDGEIDTLLSGDYQLGSKVNFRISPNEGYLINEVKWNGDPVAVTDNKGFTFEEAVNGVCTLNITYKKIEYYVSFKINNKTISSKTTKCDLNSEITINVQPSDGSWISSVKFGNENIDITNEKGFSFTRTVTRNTVVYIDYLTYAPEATDESAKNITEVTLMGNTFSIESNSEVVSANANQIGGGTKKGCGSDITPMFGVFGVITVIAGIALIMKRRKEN